MKKNTLIISFLASLYIFVPDNVYKIGLCDFGDVLCRDEYRNYGEAFLFLPLVFLFSLITYFAPERVFAAWWKFARVAIPVIFLLSLAINLELHHDPQGELQGMYDVPALVILYSIFTIGSVWQIWKGWKNA